MKLRKVALAFTFVLAVLLIEPDEAQAGGDMPTGEPEGYVSVERQDYSREYYRAPYSSYSYRYR